MCHRGMYFERARRGCARSELANCAGANAVSSAQFDAILGRHAGTRGYSYTRPDSDACSDSDAG